MDMSGVHKLKYYHHTGRGGVTVNALGCSTRLIFGDFFEGAMGAVLKGNILLTMHICVDDAQ